MKNNFSKNKKRNYVQKNYFLINVFFICIAILLQSCINQEQETKKIGHDGMAKFYREDGSLLSELTIKNGKKNGVCYEYYKSGVISNEFWYKDDIKDSLHKWFYENGNIYYFTPYKMGKKDGIRKIFYNNGKIAAEIPYKNDFPGIGTTEYSKETGKPITKIPELIFLKLKYLGKKITLTVKLSNKSTKVDYYYGDLLDNKFMSKDLVPINTFDGEGIVNLDLRKGILSRKKSVFIVAQTITEYNNPLVIVKELDLKSK